MEHPKGNFNLHFNSIHNHCNEVEKNNCSKNENEGISLIASIFNSFERLYSSRDIEVLYSCLENIFDFLLG